MLSREVHLTKRPQSSPDASHFKLVETEVSESLEEGQVLVKNLWMSVDPYMRPRMNDVKSYIPPFQLGQVLEGSAIGKVIASRHEQLPVGTYVESMNGWREYFVSGKKGLGVRDISEIAPQDYLGIMGMPGITAYVGIKALGGAKAGDRVYVSGAAGAVGSLVCQIAKAQGCTVAGSAGSDDKIDWLLNSANIDAAFNYHSENDLDTAIGRTCPKGVDLFFDNVGGSHLDAGLMNMRKNGRVILCGSIEDYNTPAKDRQGVKNLFRAIAMGLSIKGFIIFDYMADYQKNFVKDMTRWRAEGKIQNKETVLTGIERAPEAFMGLFSGSNLGKMLVKIADD